MPSELDDELDLSDQFALLCRGTDGAIDSPIAPDPRGRSGAETL
jgi:hypothetical protein